MKKWVIICLLIVTVAFWVNKKLSDRLYEDCMATQKHSKETCEYYAYYQ